MKNYYALIKFDGAYVNGFLLFGYEDSEIARLSAIKMLTEQIQVLREKQKPSSHNSDEREIKRLNSFRRCFTKPHRKTKKKQEPVLEMVELPNTFIMQAGFWLSLGSDEDYRNYICNKAREKEEHPKKGYVISQLITT
jgi:hypothetical protein